MNKEEEKHISHIEKKHSLLSVYKCEFLLYSKLSLYLMQKKCTNDLIDVGTQYTTWGQVEIRQQVNMKQC
jgi:hypothetical protein